jgi:hypothetical protein
MEVEQMMTCLLADIRTNWEEMKTDQAKIEANLREMRAGQELLKEEMLAKMETSQEWMEANQEKMDAKMDTKYSCLPNGYPPSQGQRPFKKK